MPTRSGGRNDPLLRHPETDEPKGDVMSDDVMNQQWCCLHCSSRFRFGQIIMLPATERQYAHGLGCPKCRSGNIHPADGTAQTLDAYHGEKGAIQ